MVFLPGGISVPDDIVQSGVVNPTQVATWLSMNFDYPFAVSSDTAAALTCDQSYNLTQVYSLAVAQAQAIGNPDDDVWKRVAAEIVAARASFGPPASQTLVCSPDDWALPTASGYWTTFDSSTTSSSSSATSSSSSSLGALPIVDGRFWMVRSLATPEAVSAAPSPEPVVRRQVEMARPEFMTADVARPATTEAFRPTLAINEAQPILEVSSSSSAPQTVEPVLWRRGVDFMPNRLDANEIFSNAGSVTQVTTSSSTSITVHLEHQLVTIGRYTSGQSWWDGVFLLDPSWYVPGMPKGGLLPAPADSSTGCVNGRPVAMVVVRNLRISGQWTQEAIAALSSPGGTIGPLSLFGAAPTTSSDGQTVTFEHDGMQVVALLCSPLPVLPPMDATAAAAAASSDSSMSSSSSTSSASSVQAASPSSSVASSSLSSSSSAFSSSASSPSSASSS